MLTEVNDSFCGTIFFNLFLVDSLGVWGEILNEASISISEWGKYIWLGKIYFEDSMNFKQKSAHFMTAKNFLVWELITIDIYWLNLVVCDINEINCVTSLVYRHVLAISNYPYDKGNKVGEDCNTVHTVEKTGEMIDNFGDGFTGWVLYQLKNIYSWK